MGKDDLQIGDTWTAPEHRGKGLATYAIYEILRHHGKPGRRIWYITDQDNPSSVRVMEKVGFVLAGKGKRLSRYGSKLLGTFVIDESIPPYCYQTEYAF